MSIHEMVCHARKKSNWEVLPKSILPVAKPGETVPKDLVEFYSICGGLVANAKSAFPVTIVPPQEVIPANYVLLPLIGLSEDQFYTHAPSNHPSWHWYILARSENLECITISFGQQDNGICYNSFWDRHPGDETDIIAESFSSFLEKLIESEGEMPFWF